MTVVRHETPAVGMARWAANLAPAAELARMVADTEFVPRAMRGKPDVIAAAIMYGDEIGVGPMQALAAIHVVDGRPFPSAELLRGLVLGAGHSLTVAESTGSRCRVIGRRRGEAEGTEIVWTIEMARAAGLAGKGAWRTYPRAMLLARASADVCRMMFPDVVKGLGRIPDESPEVSEDWAEYAATLGPDQPAPPELENVRWASPAPDGTPEAKTPHAASGAPPWEDGPADSPEAVESESVAPSGPDREPGWQGRALAAAGRKLEPDPVASADPEESAHRPPDPETIRRVMAAYGDLPFGPERETRLALFSAILGTPVESTKAIDRMAAYRLLGGLSRLRRGETVAIDDGHGTFTIHPGSEPPEDDET